jgi:HSP20 family molecular chaperone IbpA
MFLLEEQKMGLWQRTSTLPHNIEMKALKARLEGGLLRIDILTRDVSGKPRMKVEIE